jgi:tripartite-type tricarboxylate transporter receptor subunit TctC
MKLSNTFAAFFALVVMLCTSAVAQETGKFPQIVKLVVGFPAGGASDTVTRLLANELQNELKTTVIVENKVGAGGRISMSTYRNGPKDGSVVVIAPNGLSVLQSIVWKGKLDYDIEKDYEIIAKLVTTPIALAISVTEPVNSSSQLVAHLKANPKKASYGTAAVGGHPHLAGMMYGKAMGINWQLIPYKGGAPLITDMVGGQIFAGVNSIGEQMQQYKANRLRIIGIFGEKRNALAPEIPTMIEQGAKMPPIEAWFAAYIPAGTPKSISDRISAAMQAALAKPELKSKLGEFLFEPTYLEPRSAKRMQDAEFKLFRPIVKEAGLKPE